MPRTRMDLEHAQTLVALVVTGSISAAAEQVGVARPTVRRRLAALEEDLGVKLVVMDQGNVLPTKAGNLYVEHARRLIRDREALHDMVRNLSDEPRGTVDIAVPCGIGVDAGGQLLDVTLRAYPHLDFRVRSVVEPARELDRGAHVAVTMEMPSGEDLIVRALGSVQWLLFASAHYLEREGTPNTVDALSKHTLLLWSELYTPPSSVPLRSGGSFPISPRFVCSNFQILRDAIREGCGIGLLPSVFGQDLVPLLSDVVGGAKTLWWVTTKASAADGRMKIIHSLAAGIFRQYLVNVEASSPSNG